MSHRIHSICSVHQLFQWMQGADREHNTIPQTFYIISQHFEYLIGTIMTVNPTTLFQSLDNTSSSQCQWHGCAVERTNRCQKATKCIISVVYITSSLHLKITFWAQNICNVVYYLLVKILNIFMSDCDNVQPPTAVFQRLQNLHLIFQLDDIGCTTLYLVYNYAYTNIQDFLYISILISKILELKYTN